MDIQAKKLELLKMILETENPEILDSIKKLFKKQKEKDFWENTPEKLREEILSGIQEIEKEETVDYNDFMNKHR